MADYHKFPYRWRLADGYPAKGITPHGCKVFGTFICGGGSTMGYKLAGYDHIGGVEIDPRVANVYKLNHHPKHLYVEDLRKFNERSDLPDELYDLDVLDGSPPCSTFSMAGSREKAWGKEKVFREGQAKQTLDDLVFVYCDTIAKLKPRVCLLENVAGIVKGNARSYCKRIIDRLRSVGYKRVQVFLLNAANMGVPQTRQRTFFIGLRDDMPRLPKLKIEVDEKPIPFGEIRDKEDTAQNITNERLAWWKKRKRGDRFYSDIIKRETGKEKWFTHSLACDEYVVSTIDASGMQFCFESPRLLNEREREMISTFPIDFKFDNRQDNWFMTGMCVSPVQMAHIADAIYNQWLKPIHATDDAQ